MYLLERLFGIAVYVYMLGMTCVLLAFTKVNIKAVLWLYIAGLCVTGFFYTPSETGDLYRIYEAMDWYATMDLRFFVKNYVVDSSVPASRLLFWLVASTGVNRLLPVVSALLCYGLLFSVLDRSRKLLGISRQNFAIALFVLMTTSAYISVVGGVRMMIAMTLVVYCFFRESVEHRSALPHLPLYLIAVLMHNMGVAILGMRLLALMMNGNRKLRLRLAVVFLAAVAVTVVMARYGFFAEALLEKIREYLTEDSYSDTWEYMMGILIAVGIGIMYFKYRAWGCAARQPMLKELNFSMLLSGVLGAVFCFVFTIFYRFVGHLMPVLAMPMLMTTLQTSEGKPVRGKVQIPFRMGVILFGCILLLISCARGSLSSLKFFVLS